MSPHLENCCLRLSANVSYQDAALDIKYLTGVTVPAKTQQRLVHYQDFNQPIATADINWFPGSAWESMSRGSASPATIEAEPLDLRYQALPGNE